MSHSINNSLFDGGPGDPITQLEKTRNLEAANEAEGPDQNGVINECTPLLQRTTDEASDSSENEHTMSGTAIKTSQGDTSDSTSNIIAEKVIDELYKRVQANSEDEVPKNKCCCTCEVSCTFCQRGALLATESLQRASAEGWVMFKTIVFPLAQELVRLVWAACELLSAVLAFSLSLASLLNKNKEHDIIHAFNYVHIVLASLSIALSILDTIYNIRCGNSCQTSNTWCGKYIDIVRMVIAEALIYPLLICDLFEFIISKGFDETTPINLALFINSCFSFVLYVFIARIVIVVGMIARLHRARTPARQSAAYSHSALLYQLVFLTQLIFQMVAQTLSLIAIGERFHLENHNNTVSNTDTTIYASPFLWIMIGSGCIMPYVGFFSFFMVTYYWVREFPIALFLDMISLWRMNRGRNDFVDIENTVRNPRDRILDTITSFFNLSELQRDFDKLRRKNWCIKFTYPFRTPVIVCVCVLVLLPQATFSTMGFLIPHNEIPSGEIRQWEVFFSVVTAVWFVSNVYVSAVAFFSAVVLPIIYLLLYPILYYLYVAVMTVVTTLLAIKFSMPLSLLFSFYNKKIFK